MKKIVFSLLAVSLTIASCSWILLRNREEVPVRAITAVKGEITATLSATGKVVSLQEARISTAVAGRVRAVEANAGDWVAAGAVLARLDGRELEEQVKVAQAALREANVNVRRLKRDYEALDAVFAVGGASRLSVQDAKSSLEIAKTEVNRAAAKLRENKVGLEKLEVRAPFGGIITRKETSPGEWVSPGEALFTLADESARQIEVMVDESDAGLVGVDQVVELTSDAFPGSNWLEQVTRVDPAVQKNESANSIRVLVTCGTLAPDLKLGQQVDAKIRTAHRDDAVKLPFECLTGKAGRTTVAKISNGTVRFVPVVTGIEDATSVEIIQGVSAGEAIIVPEGKPLEEGQRVKRAGQELSGQ